MTEPNRCPACLARFRGSAICSRCGADLGCMMQLSVEAWRLREAARQAVAAGDFTLGLTLAGQAQDTQGTPAGSALRALCAWLRASP